MMRRCIYGIGIAMMVASLLIGIVYALCWILGVPSESRVILGFISMGSMILSIGGILAGTPSRRSDLPSGAMDSASPARRDDPIH